MHIRKKYEADLGRAVPSIHRVDGFRQFRRAFLVDTDRVNPKPLDITMKGPPGSSSNLFPSMTLATTLLIEEVLVRKFIVAPSMRDNRVIGDAPSNEVFESQIFGV